MNNQEFINAINKAKKNKSSIKKVLIKFNVTEEQYKEIINPNPIVDESFTKFQPKQIQDENITSTLQFSEAGYVYNKEADVYIFSLKCAPKMIVLRGEDHRAIIANYSNWIQKGATINQITRKFGWPRNYFIEYKTKFGLTHDREPLSAEEVMSSDIGTSAAHILEEKRFALHQEYERQSWQQTQVEAANWRSLQAREFIPFSSFLDTYQPPVIEPLDAEHEINKKTGHDVFVTGLSDLHFGGATHSQSMYKPRELSSEITGKIVDSYASKIAAHVSNQTKGYKKCVVFCLGDILNGLRGCTERGTPLENDILREDQFNFAYDTLLRYLLRMIEIFEEVEVHSVRGNHDGVDNYILFKSIGAYFRNDDRITIHNNLKRTSLVRIKDVLFLLDHGESARYKSAQVPSKGKERESYIQSLLLTHPHLLPGLKQKVFIQGHLHHYEQHEFNDFEFIMFSSPTSSNYQDAHHWAARPRQNCVVVNDEGVSSVLHFYF